MKRTSTTGVYQRCHSDCPARCDRHKYTFVVPLPRDGGKQRQRWVSGFATVREAAAARRAALSSLDQSRPLPPTRRDRTSVRGYLLDQWLPAQSLRQQTRTSYQGALDRYALPYIGDKRLAALTGADLRALYRQLRERDLAAATIALVHAVLRRALADAVADGLLAANPADAPRVAPPGPRRASGRPDLTLWSSAQAARLFAATADDRLAALWVVALNTGLRRGELIGLRWDDVDLAAGTLTVRRSVGLAAGRIVETEPKTEAGRRTVPLPAPAITALREHRKRQAAERLAAGPAWVGDDRVFCKREGGRLHPAWLGPALHTAADRAGLPRIRVHDLRHTFGRIAVNELGLPVPVVARIMGHADPKITVSIYGHATGDDLARAAAAFGEVFG